MLGVDLPFNVGGGDNINYHYPHSERYIMGGVFEICRDSIVPE